MTLLNASNNPLYEIADSFEGNNRISTIPRRKVRPLKFYYEKLFKNIVGEQERGSAVSPFTLSVDTKSDHVADNGDAPRGLLVPRTINRTPSSFIEAKNLSTEEVSLCHPHKLNVAKI